MLNYVKHYVNILLYDSIIRLTECGVYDYWTSSISANLQLYKLRDRESEETDMQVMTFNSLKDVYLMLIIGIIFSVIAFITERVYVEFKNCQFLLFNYIANSI